MRNVCVRVLVALAFIIATAPVASADRLFTSGFELQSVTNGIEWYESTSVPAAGTINTIESFVRSGLASYRVNGMSSTVPMGNRIRFASSGSNGVAYYFRTYFYLATAPSANTTIMGFGTVSPDRIRVRLNTDRTLTMVVDVSETIGSSSALALGQWYRLELLAMRNASTPGTDDTVEMRIDGVAAVSSATAQINSTFNRINIGGNLAGETATTGDWYFDDVALNSSSGSAPTSWPGEGSIEMLVPNGTGEFDQTTTLVGAASAWEAMDDGIATGTVDATDYVSLTSGACVTWSCSPGSRVAVAMSNLSGASAVTLVQVAVRFSTEGAATSKYSLAVQTSDGGTDSTTYTTANVVGNTVWFLGQASTQQSTEHLILTADPAAAAWTQTTVNAMQVMIRADDGDDNVWITSAWAMVEYTPGDAPSTGAGAGLLLLGVQ